MVRYFLLLIGLVLVFIGLGFSAGGGNSPAYQAGSFVYAKASFLMYPIIVSGFLFLRAPRAVVGVVHDIFAINKYYYFYLIIALMSLPLAVDPQFSFVRLGYTFLGVGAIFCLGMQYRLFFHGEEGTATIREHVKIFSALALLTLFFAVTIHGTSTLIPGVRNALSMYRVIHPNTVSALFAYLMIWHVVWGYSARKDAYDKVIALLLFGAIVVLFSRTVLVSIMACFFVVAFLLRRRYSMLFMIGLGLICFLNIMALYIILGQVTPDSFLAIFARGADVKDLYTLTLRTELWDRLADTMSLKQWIFGHGYAVVTPDFGVDFGTGELFGAHNAYLSLFFGTGVVSLLLFVMFVFDSFMRSVRYIQWSGITPQRLIILASTVVLVMTSMASEEVGVGVTCSFAFYLLMKTVFKLSDNTQ
jgi:hypothetical protein